MLCGFLPLLSASLSCCHWWPSVSLITLPHSILPTGLSTWPTISDGSFHYCTQLCCQCSRSVWLWEDFLLSLYYWLEPVFHVTLHHLISPDLISWFMPTFLYSSVPPMKRTNEQYQCCLHSPQVWCVASGVSFLFLIPSSPMFVPLWTNIIKHKLCFLFITCQPAAHTPPIDVSQPNFPQHLLQPSFLQTSSFLTVSLGFSILSHFSLLVLSQCSVCSVSISDSFIPPWDTYFLSGLHSGV